jgi:TRAP-type C4-dicarboxylate transport system substrate-binding protein
MRIIDAIRPFLLGGAFCMLATAAHGQEVTLKFHHFNPPATPAHQRIMKPWADSVMADSKGRIKVDIYPAMGLGGKPPELINQVRDGVVDVTFTLPSYTPGRFPISEVFELPFVNSDAVTMARAFQDFAAQHLREEFKDFHILAIWTHAGVALHSTKPVKGLDQFKGLTVRTSGPGGTLFLEAVGANAVPMQIPELPSALSRGVVDAAMLPFEILPAFKVQDMTRYHVTLDGGRRFYAQTFVMLMNKARYEKLPPDLKKVIDDNSGLVLAENAARAWMEFEEVGMKAARARGNEVVMLSREESERIEKASAAAIERWIADVGRRGIDGRKMVDAARAAIAKHQPR